MINCHRCGAFISHDSSNLSQLCEECDVRMDLEYIDALRWLIDIGCYADGGEITIEKMAEITPGEICNAN